MDNPPVANIFSFVNVRAPHESLPRRTYLSLPKNTPLQDAIQQNGFPATEADNFLNSTDNPEINGSDPAIDQLGDIQGRFFHDNPQDFHAAESIVKDVTGSTDVATFLSTNTALKTKLVDLSYASMLSEMANAQLKYRYQSALKVFIALENLVELGASPDGLTEFLDTPLLLDQQIFEPLKQQKRDELQMRIADQEYRAQEREQFRRTLWENLVNSHVALQELKQVETAYLQKLERYSTIMGGASSSATSTPLPDFRDAPVKKMLKETGHVISPNAEIVLNQMLTAYDNYHPSQVLEQLQAQVQKHSQVLYTRYGVNELFEFANYVNRQPQEVLSLEGMPIVSGNDMDLSGRPADLTGYGNPTSSPSAIPNVFQKSYPVGNVKPIGIGDLKIVRQKLLRYEAGEIAQIENVMASETKSVTHRKLSRTEELQVEFQERTTESVSDRSTTDRFELNRESSSAVQEETKKSAGAEVSASYGFVKAKASGAYSNARSSQKAKKDASTYARQVVDKATEKVIEKVRKERSIKRIAEVEDTFLHSFENDAADATHIRGVYRWVDKVYEAQIFNYGKRLMFEFIVPEPAAQYKQLISGATVGDVGVKKPTPLPDNFNFLHISELNFAFLAHEYGVRDVELWPVHNLIIAKTFSSAQLKAVDTGSSAHSSSELTIPDGYLSKQVKVTTAISMEQVIHLPRPGDDNGDNWLIISNYNKLRLNVGNLRFDFSKSGKESAWYRNKAGVVPISMTSERLTGYGINIEVHCYLSGDGRMAWQKKVYDQIMEAYTTQQAAYDAAVNGASFRNELDLENRNSAFNTRIVREELQKSCLTLLTTNFFDENGAIVAPAPPHGMSEINLPRQRSQAKYIQFMEQAFEWTELTYKFYAYFWGRKNEWAELFLRENVDPAFRDFLRAGAGRVLIPVTPGYEDAVMHYLETGVLWQGGDAPVIDSPLFRSIAQEIRAEYAPEGEPESEPWEVRLPTSLLILQEDGSLPDYTPEPEV